MPIDIVEHSLNFPKVFDTHRVVSLKFHPANISHYTFLQQYTWCSYKIHTDYIHVTNNDEASWSYSFYFSKLLHKRAICVCNICIFILVKEYIDHPNHSNALVVTPNEIHKAYHKLTGEITDILATKNFKKLRRACLNEISLPTSTLPKSLQQDIRPTNTLDDMLDVLALSPYWNWFDTRLLQALVSVSGSPEAEMMVEQFKQIHYVHKVSEVLPCVIVRPIKDTIRFIEKFNKDPEEITLLDLLNHKQILEYDMMDIGENKIILSCIRTGCVELVWQVPSDLVHQAYTSIKKNQNRLSSLEVDSVVCKEADVLAGLPILWRGQEVGEIGPIEPLPEHVRQEPYSLPQGFHWVSLSGSDVVAEVVKFLNKYGIIKLDSFINFIIKHLNTKDEWQFGIRTTSGKLVAAVMAFPICVNIGGVSVTCMDLLLCYNPKYDDKRMFYMLIKETMRRANLHNINHYVIYIRDYDLPKPVTTSHIWQYNFDHPTNSPLPSSPRTPGWRRMTLEDVPSALAFVNKWSSQFEIRQVFSSEEEFAYNFLCSILPNYVYTYVVENEGNITDLVNFRLISKIDMATSIIIVASKLSSIKQLLIDALVCAKELGFKVLLIKNFNIKPNILSSLSFHYKNPRYFSIYNYKYHEISETTVWNMMC